MKDKYTKTPKEMPKAKGNRDVISKIVSAESSPTDTDIQKHVNAELQKPVNTVEVEAKKSIKKATFELDSKLHKRLRAFAVESDTTMVEIVEKALTEYLDSNE